MATDPTAQIEKLRQALADLEAQERDRGANYPAQKAELQAQLAALIQTVGIQLAEGAAVGGDVIDGHKIQAGGDVIIAGEGATLIVNPTAEGERDTPAPPSQTINGPQTNIQGDVHGPVFSGQFNAPVQIGDIKVGNVSGTGIAIGHGAQARVTQGVPSAEDIAQVFAPIIEKVAALPEGPARVMAQQAAQGLQAEAAKGAAADEKAVNEWFNFLAQTANDAWEVALATFVHPIAGVSLVFKKIADKAKEEKAKKSGG